jgi:hypothetical protein
MVNITAKNRKGVFRQRLLLQAINNHGLVLPKIPYLRKQAALAYRPLWLATVVSGRSKAKSL